MPNWSGPISLKGAKGDSVPQTLPNDLAPNSVAIAPVAGDGTSSGLTQRNASGTTVFASDAAGNVSCAGTLAAAGALSAASAAIAGNETVGGNLSVTGTLTAGALTASGTNIGGDQTVQGNDTVNQNLTVKGSSTLAGVSCTGLSDTGNLSVTGTVTAGNVVVTNTLTPQGDCNVGGKLTVQKNAVVNGGTQTVGLLTCSGGMTTPSGITVTGGTSTDTLGCTGDGSILGTTTLGATTASSLVTNGNLRSSGNLTCTSGTTTLGGTLSVTGAATLSSTLGVTGATTLGALTAASSSITGNESVGGTLTVTGATSLAGVTASGTVTAANVTLASGGKITFPDGTTQTTTGAVANDPSYNSLTLAPVTGDSNAVALKLKNASGTALYSVDASGNTSVGGTLAATGATTLAGLTASSASVTGNATVGGTLGVTGATTTAALTSSATVTGKNLALTNGGGGVLTFADGTTQATAASGATATASRSIWPVGGFYSSNMAANSLYTLEETQLNDSSLTATGGLMNVLWKFPFPCSITGWSINQWQGNGTNTFQITKNRTTSSLGSIVTVTAGSAATTGFPGNQFSGTFPKGTYTFAAGDVVGIVYQHSSGTVTNLKMVLLVEWA